MSKYNANRFSMLESTESKIGNESKIDNESKTNIMATRMPSRATDTLPRSERTLASGTMASLTKQTSSYSNRFAENERRRNDPTYVPPQKPVNITSENDFPTLGTPKIVPIPIKTGFVTMAKEWGKKIEEEEEANRTRIQNAEIERRIHAKEQYMKEKYGTPECKVRSKNGLIIRAKKNEYYDKEQRAFKPIMEDNVSDDSFESGPSHEDVIEDEEEESLEDEFNTNIGYERRHKDELY